MSDDGSYCYSTGIKRADCLTCGYYKLNYPKVAHSIDCFIMREYESSSVYYNFPKSYDGQNVYLVTSSGRVYLRYAPSTIYSGRRVYLPINPDNGGYGHKTVYTAMSKELFNKSATFVATVILYVLLGLRLSLMLLPLRDLLNVWLPSVALTVMSHSPY